MALPPQASAHTAPVPAAPPQPVKIGSVVFPLNPQDVSEQAPQQVSYLPGMAGAIRCWFGPGAHSWTLSGHTGHGGVAAIQKIAALVTKPGGQNKPQSFLYPWKYGSRVFSVYVDDCTFHESVSNGGFLFEYTILLHEAVPQSSQPPLVRV